MGEVMRVPQPQEQVNKTPAEVIDLNLVQTIFEIYKNDCFGANHQKPMFEEEKRAFIEHLKASMETETSVEAKEAAKLFIKYAEKGENHEA